jgi:predicted nucleotidyltransferase
MEIKEEIELISKLKDRVSNKGGKLMNAYVSGSHLYGWTSKDSDIDIRGCFILDSEKFLGLSNPIEVIEIKSENNKDITLFEVKKLIGLALQSNCNILEEINSEQIYKDADFVKLKQLINNAFGKKGIYNSYRGMAEFNYKKFILAGRNTIKKYLYVYRALMAGIYCLQTGLIKPNIEELNKVFKSNNVKKLLEIKINGLENEPLKDLEEGTLDAEIKTLFDRIDEAYIKSKIPEKPSEEDIAEIDKFLINLRIET